MKNFICTFLLMYFSPLNGQTYVLSSFQDSYDEIDEFTSIYFNIGGKTWDYNFHLDFEFPYFDSTFTELKCSFLGYCEVETENSEGRLSLLEFGYEMDLVENISQIEDESELVSDVRYAFTEIDNIKAFVLQYTRVRLISDPTIEDYDSFINFQQWYFEDGSIELRFGEHNLENNPNYIPGEGFYLIPSNSDPRLIGPWIALENPFSEEEILGINGEFESTEIVTDTRTVLNTLPPPGWVIRFEYTTSNIVEIENEENVDLNPNPVYSILQISSEHKLDFMEIYDLFGNLVHVCYESSSSIKVDFLNSGTYILRAYHDEVSSIHRFIKL